MGLVCFFALCRTPHFPKQREDPGTQEGRPPYPSFSGPNLQHQPVPPPRIFPSPSCWRAGTGVQLARRLLPLPAPVRLPFNECAPMPTLPQPLPVPAARAFDAWRTQPQPSGPLCGQVHLILLINLTRRLMGSGGGESIIGETEAGRGGGRGGGIRALSKPPSLRLLRSCTHPPPFL